jgi:hypothetical protein
VERLEKCMTDIAIQDVNARVFWNTYFAGKSRVSFDKFERELHTFLKVHPEVSYHLILLCCFLFFLAFQKTAH